MAVVVARTLGGLAAEAAEAEAAVAQVAVVAGTGDPRSACWPIWPTLRLPTPLLLHRGRGAVVRAGLAKTGKQGV